MDPLFLGILGFISLLFFIAIGVPVGISMLSTGLIGLLFLVTPSQMMEVFYSRFFEFSTRYEFTAMPMFLIMGYISMVAGITGSAYDSAKLWLGRLPGGMGMATCVASALFGACCGNGVAATAAMSRIAVPEMLKQNYDQSLAVGTVAAAATVAVLIPPSIIMVIYAVFTEISLGKLLLAGYVPGILSMAIYMIMIFIRVTLRPQLAPYMSEKISWKDRIISLKGLWPITVLGLVLLGGIYSGYFTATEAAAVSAVTAFIIMIILGRFKLSTVKDAFQDSLKVTAMSFLLLVSAVVFVVFITISGLPQSIAALITSMNISPTVFIILVCFLYLFLGFFMPSMSMLLVTLPVLSPVLVDLDINLIWFGIIFIKMSEVASISPPLGLSVYVVKGVVGDQIEIGTIFRGIGWFILMDFFTIAILIMFPQIVLWLPNAIRI